MASFYSADGVPIRDSKRRARLISRMLILLGGALIAVGAFLNWRHIYGHPPAPHVGSAVLTVATPPAVAPSPPAAPPVSKQVASSHVLTTVRENEAGGTPRARSSTTAAHPIALALPSGPVPVPAAIKGATAAQPAPPAASALTASVPPRGALPSRGQVRHPATPPSNVPPKPADHPAPPRALEAQKPPAPPASQKPAVQAVQTVQTGLVAPIQAPRTPIASSAHQEPLSNRLFTVRIGPVLDHDHAAAIAKQLSVGGFTQVQVSAQTGYRVLSEPLPRKAAESLITTVTERGFRADMEPSSGDTVQVLFGVFTAQKEAEALSSRIAAVGYDAWVREGAVYTLRLGPYPSASVTAIAGLVKAGASNVPITTDPIP